MFGIWAHPTVQPEVPAELFSDADAEICYVLESGGLADLLALERACAKNGLPSPTESFDVLRQAHLETLCRAASFALASLCAVRRPPGSRGLRNLVDVGRYDAEADLHLIPVAIYWGRSPDKERSPFKLLFAENWEAVGRIRKFFATVIYGRDTLMRFSHASASEFDHPARPRARDRISQGIPGACVSTFRQASYSHGRARSFA